jgi:hypothetical protein
MMINLVFTGIRVDGNIIVDGHHRYLASLLARYELDQIPCTKPQAKRQVDWLAVKFVENDWDTAERVEILNNEDARYNNMTLDELIKKIG